MKKLFAVKDTAARTFADPIFQHMEQQAIRLFVNEVNDPRQGNLLNTNRSDFELHYIGDFDETTGQLTPVNRLLMRGADVPATKGGE